MKKEKLKALVKHGESDVLEFKKSTGELVGAMQTICSFLNNDVGGTVLIGVTDDGKVVGQEVTDKTRKEIATELNKFEPHADIDSEYVLVNGKRYVIVLSPKQALKAPYLYDGRAYKRSESTTRRMPQEEYEYLLQNRRSFSLAWDTLVTNDCTLNDLDKKLIRNVIKTAVIAGRIPHIAENTSIVEILKKLELIVGNKLTNAAVVLFCKKQLKQFMQSELKVARFLGLDKSEFLDSKIHRGNVFELLEKAMDFLVNHLPIASRIEEGKLQRTEIPAIPYKVLREALVNAFCHRDYSMRNGDISVAIYDDRVEIVSAGRLPPEIKLSALTKQHVSRPRNKLIANVFYACRMIERWGKGTIDMINLCKQAEIPVPHFEESTSSFSVILPLKEPMRQFARVKQVSQ